MFKDNHKDTKTIVDFEHVFVCWVVIFIVWMIFII